LSLSFSNLLTLPFCFTTPTSTAISTLSLHDALPILSFAPGTTTRTVTVPVLGDLLNEANETFFVNLSNPTNAVISDGQAIGTIKDHNSSPLKSSHITTSTAVNCFNTNTVSTVKLAPA